MKIAILTFEGFNELDSFIALGILNRMKGDGWDVQICCPCESVTSMNGVTVRAQQPLEFANSADVVLFGSGVYTRDIAKDRTILDRLQLDPGSQIIGAQCSGTLLLAVLGILGDLPACTDLTTKPWVVDAGVGLGVVVDFGSGTRNVWLQLGHLTRLPAALPGIRSFLPHEHFSVKF